MGRLGWAAVCVASVFAAPSGVRGQDDAVTVSGVVREEGTNAPVSGALVRIPERGLQFLTALDGRFSFAAVPPGSYTIRVGGPGTEKMKTFENVASVDKVGRESITVRF